MIEFEKVFDLFTDLGMSEADYYVLYINATSNETLFLPGGAHPDPGVFEEDLEELEKRIEEEPGWIKLPNKYELNLGNRVPKRFADEHLEPDDCDLVYDFFRSRGAYRNFRNFLDRLGKTDEWYKFEENAIREALKQWLRDEEIEFSESDRPGSQATLQPSPSDTPASTSTATSSFQVKIWDHCRYVTNKNRPYDEMARHLETMAKAGVSTTIIYMPEVISLDDYCRAAAAAGLKVEARIFPAWQVENPVNRTLPEHDLAEMERRFGIRLAKTCANHPHNRDGFLAAARSLAEKYSGRLAAIHLDFIRNDNAVLLMDYPCQCDACQALYQRYFGCPIPDAAMRSQPAVLYKMLALRNANVTALVRTMRELTREYDLDLTIAARANYLNSLDITAPPVWGLGPAVLEGQDWVEWVDEGLIDAVYPMNYHTNLDLFQAVLNDHLRLLTPQLGKLFSGVGVSSSMGANDPAAIAARLEAVQAAGLPGAVLFNKTNVYNDDYLAVIRDFTH